jgi:hypothetical protein
MHGIGEESQFVRFLDEARADEAARARSRERWLRQQTTEQATLAGTLVELAERGCPVTVRIANGRVHSGTIIAVGTDFGLVRAGVDAYLALDGIAWIRPTDPDVPPATGERAAALDLTMVELLHRVAPERPRVLLSLRGDPEPVTGQLIAVGVDVLTLRMDSARRRGTCFVPAAAVWEAVVTGD